MRLSTFGNVLLIAFFSTFLSLTALTAMAQEKWVVVRLTDSAVRLVDVDGSASAIDQIIDYIRPEGTISLLGVSEARRGSGIPRRESVFQKSFPKLSNARRFAKESIRFGQAYRVVVQRVSGT